MIINRKIKRTMLESKSQYIGSLALIIISCLLYTMLNLLSGNMAQMTYSFEKNYVQEDASFVTDKKLENIEDLEARFNAGIEESSVFDYDILKNKTLRIFSRNEKVNIPAILEGNDLSGKDILIDPAFAKANKQDIRSNIQILGETFKIAGYVSLPNYIYPLKSENDLVTTPESFGIAVMGKDDFKKFNKGKSFYSIKFYSDSGDVDYQAMQFRDYLKGHNIIVSQWTDIGENKRVAFVNTKIQGISRISSSLPVAILLLTCILTGIVIWRLLNRESVIVGTLYAQGYRKNELRRHYLMYPLLIAVIGGLTGTILGALLLKPMLLYMVKYFNLPVESIAFDPGTIVLSLLLPVIFLCISGILILNRELRHSPVELMRGVREKNRINFIEGHLRLEKLKFSTKFKIREQVRSLSRLAFLLAGVMLATMLLLLGFTAKSSLDYMLEEGMKNTYKLQYEYVYNSLHTEQPPAGTETFSPNTFTMKSDGKSDFVICGVEPDSKYLSLKDRQGIELGKDKVIITEPLAARLKVNPGDTIEVVNKLNAREYKVTVDSIAETFAGNFIFMPLSRFNDTFELPAGSYAGLWSNVKLDIPEKILYSARSMEETEKDFNESLQPVQSTIGVIAFMSFIIGLIVIYVVTSMIIEENRGNISLMKVMGYRRKEINSLILNSSSMIIVLGYILGIPLVLASMRSMFDSLTESLNMTMPVTINYPYVIAGFAVVYFTYELSKALSRKKIYRISMSEALKAGME